jgi:hypothetical protein
MKLASTKATRDKTAFSIEAMAADIETTGRHLLTIFPPDLHDSTWRFETVDEYGNVWQHDGASLDDAYNVAMCWPDEPAPF